MAEADNLYQALLYTELSIHLSCVQKSVYTLVYC